VHTSRELESLSRSGIDLAIRYGRGGWSGVTAEQLGGEHVVPVAAPAFLKARNIRDAEDLIDAPLLFGDIRENWTAWFRNFGIRVETTLVGTSVTDDAAALEMAVDGGGVALARSRLAEHDLRSGRLAIAVDQTMPASFSYWLVRPADAMETAEINCVAQWIRDQFANW